MQILAVVFILIIYITFNWHWYVIWNNAALLRMLHMRFGGCSGREIKIWRGDSVWSAGFMRITVFMGYITGYIPLHTTAAAYRDRITCLVALSLQIKCDICANTIAISGYSWENMISKTYNAVRIIQGYTSGKINSPEIRAAEAEIMKYGIAAQL